MTQKSIFYSLMLTSFFLVSCASTATKKSSLESKGTPGWVSSMKSTKYPSSLYIVGVGHAQKENEDLMTDQKIADSTAIKAIAEQIRVTIKGSSTDIQEETISAGKSTSSQHIEIMTKLDVEIEDMEGIAIPERFFDESTNTYYSLAALDKAKASFSLNKLIEEARGRAHDYYENAKRLEQETEYSQSLQTYFRSIEELYRSFAKERILIVISGANSRSTISKLSVPVIEGKILDLLSHVKMEKVSGDKQEGEISQPLKKPLVISTNYSKNEDLTPLTDFPVRFSFLSGQGVLQEEALVNSEGIVRSFVSKVIPSGVRRNVVSAQLDYSKFTADHSSFMPVKVEFSYTLPTKHDIRILLQIKETSFLKERGSIVEAKILQKLREAEFTILDKKGVKGLQEDLNNSSVEELQKSLGDIAEVAVIGSIESIKKSEINGLFFAESSGVIKLIHLKTGTVLKVLPISPKRAGSDGGYDTKGAGLTSKIAIRNSLTKTAQAVALIMVIQVEEAFNSGFKKQ